MSSSIGTLFRVTTFGESHGRAIGCIVDGCPARIPLSPDDIQTQLNRRRPGASALSTPRQETDAVTILSGVERGLTLGTPIGLSIPNADTRPADYAEMEAIPRPSHADFTYAEKYGMRARSGGGRASARETAARVAAGAIAEKMLAAFHPVEIVAWSKPLATSSRNVPTWGRSPAPRWMPLPHAAPTPPPPPGSWPPSSPPATAAIPLAA